MQWLFSATQHRCLRITVFTSLWAHQLIDLLDLQRSIDIEISPVYRHWFLYCQETTTSLLKVTLTILLWLVKIWRHLILKKIVPSPEEFPYSWSPFSLKKGIFHFYISTNICWQMALTSHGLDLHSTPIVQSRGRNWGSDFCTSVSAYRSWSWQSINFKSFNILKIVNNIQK